MLARLLFGALRAFTRREDAALLEILRDHPPINTRVACTCLRWQWTARQGRVTPPCSGPCDGGLLRS